MAYFFFFCEINFQVWAGLDLGLEQINILILILAAGLDRCMLVSRPSCTVKLSSMVSLLHLTYQVQLTSVILYKKIIHTANSTNTITPYPMLLVKGDVQHCFLVLPVLQVKKVWKNFVLLV